MSRVFLIRSSCFPVDTGRKLNLYKTLCTFNLRPVPTGLFDTKEYFKLQNQLLNTAWKSPYPELFWSTFSRIRTEYGEILRISSYSVRMQENAGKMRTKITPNTDNFCAVHHVFKCSMLYFCSISFSCFKYSHLYCLEAVTSGCSVKNFAKFTGKHLCQGLFFNKVAALRHETLLKKWLWHRYFPVTFAKNF